jgi:hypothetical protein
MTTSTPAARECRIGSWEARHRFITLRRSHLRALTLSRRWDSGVTTSAGACVRRVRIVLRSARWVRRVATPATVIPTS